MRNIYPRIGFLSVVMSWHLGPPHPFRQPTMISISTGLSPGRISGT